MDDGTRFSVISSSDHGGLLWIAASLGLTYFGISCGIRVLISHKNFHRDSVMLIIATVFGSLQVICVFVQLSAGFGKSLDLISTTQLDKLEKAGYASEIFFVLALSASKCSIAWFIARLTPDKKHLLACSITFWASVVWGVVGALLLSLRCSLARPWKIIGENCSSLIVHWQVIAAFDVILEVALLGLITSIVWNLQTIWRTKVVVVAGFAFRLPLILLAILHLHYLDTSLHSSNQTLDQITPSIIEQAQLSWAIIAATIPCLKAFIATLGSGYLGGHFNRDYATGQGYTNQSESHMMDTIGVSSHVQSKVVGGKFDTISNRSLTRASQEVSEENVIKHTRDYAVRYE